MAQGSVVCRRRPYIQPAISRAAFQARGIFVHRDRRCGPCALLKPCWATGNSPVLIAGSLTPEGASARGCWGSGSVVWVTLMLSFSLHSTSLTQVRLAQVQLFITYYGRLPANNGRGRSGGDSVRERGVRFGRRACDTSYTAGLCWRL
jgi:hypothetical protein